MTIDITSFFFNSSIADATATSAWGTSIGQSKSKNCRIEDEKPGVLEILTGMLYKSIADKTRVDLSAGSQSREILLCSLFDKIYINDTLLKGESFLLTLVRERSKSHDGRLLISYPPYAKIDGIAVNQNTINAMSPAIDCKKEGCWFVHDISIRNQDELHFSAIVVDADKPKVYNGTSRQRSEEWNSLIETNAPVNRTRKPLTSLQTIYFGSPGTGKSFKIKDKILNGLDDNYIFRTTFHPDTDYASFVGCYKPVCHKGSHSVAKTHSLDDLAEILKEEYAKADIKTLALHSFAFKYADYFNGNIASYSKKDLVLKAGLTEDYKVEINKIVNLYNWMLKNEYVADCDTITYKFSPQTFTNAYIKAWQNPTENVYLVIEEINRGNCAQIFGDLFQLLDRNDDGVSEYPIKADGDLTKYLQDKLGVDHEGIADGKIKLPANLNILATMNTSDQSLFPMDSAFKRRWEWQYVPTSVTGDKKKVLKVESKEEKVLINKAQEQKVLKLGMYQYDWSLFLEKINKCITDATHSDDKQLGFWFVKTPKNSNEIKIETFVSKVIFYLWTDVFKDFGAKATNPFAFKNAEGVWVVCPFSSFFDPYTGEINLGQIHGFMYNLGIIPELEPEIQAAIEQNIIEEGNPEE